MKTTHLIPTILCGGAGTRLWPLSRDEYPKQLLALTGPETMLQATIRRMTGFKHTKVDLAPNPIIVCNEGHRLLVAEQIMAMGYQGAPIILEPVGRNTAPALTVAVLQAMRNDQDPLLLAMPADHQVEDVAAFHLCLAMGVEPALCGNIVTFGVVPDRPETGYGYIQANQLDPHAEQIYPIIRFSEKPDRETAERYLAQGGYYWNSGMFLVQASTWLKAMDQLQPEIFSCCKIAFDRSIRESDFLRLDKETFSSCPADSIDYAVMERLNLLSDTFIQGVVTPMKVGWSDVGSWDTVWKINRKTAGNNSVSGDVMLNSTYNSLVLSTSRLVSCVGVDGLVIVETPDAVLVAQKKNAQEVKEIVMALKSDGRKEGHAHRKVYRPWGWYDSLEHGDRFQVKRIVVNPGAILSLQLHHQRSEHWIIVKGTAKITLGDQIVTRNENESIFVPVGEKHRVQNVGNIPLEIIEVQSGAYLGEDDIVRLEDRYGRVAQ